MARITVGMCLAQVHAFSVSDPWMTALQLPAVMAGPCSLQPLMKLADLDC